MQSGVVLMCYYLGDFNTIPDWNNISSRNRNTISVLSLCWAWADDGADKLVKEVRRCQTDDLSSPPSVSLGLYWELWNTIGGTQPFYSLLLAPWEMSQVRNYRDNTNTAWPKVLDKVSWKRRKFQFNLFQVWCLNSQFEVKGKSQLYKLAIEFSKTECNLWLLGRGQEAEESSEQSTAGQISGYNGEMISLEDD